MSQERPETPLTIYFQFGGLDTARTHARTSRSKGDHHHPSSAVEKDLHGSFSSAFASSGRQHSKKRKGKTSFVVSIVVAAVVIFAVYDHTIHHTIPLSRGYSTYIPNMPAPPILLETTTKQEPPQRIDSFPSLSMEVPSDDDDISDNDDNDLEAVRQTSSSSLLIEENERLRAQVAQLQDKVTALQQNRSKHKRLKRANSETDVTVVLELSPPNLRQVRNHRSNSNNSNNNNHNHKPRQSPLPKEDRSVETNDDRETIEPSYLDLEAHRSADGLHHRSHYYNSNSNNGGGGEAMRRRSRSPTKRKPPTSLALQVDNDDDSSFPSNHNSDSLEDDDDDDDNDRERDGLLLTCTGGGGSSSNDNDNNNNDNNRDDFFKNVWDRAGWLVGLLVLQSMSSFILARNEALLQEHTIIIRFLTMLVGAGGNAGNQASVRGKYIHISID